MGKKRPKTKMYRTAVVLLAVCLFHPSAGVPVSAPSYDLVLTDDRGEITSANYPDNYPANSTSTWLFTCDPTKYVYVAFREFQSEWGLDILKVYDGPNADSRLLWTHSGDGPPPGPFQASANTLYITFETNDSVQMKGFRANYVMMDQQTKD